MRRQQILKHKTKIIGLGMAMSVFMTVPSFASAGEQNGILQAQAEHTDAAAISENDFIVSGNNSVTTNNADRSILTNWAGSGYSADVPMVYHTFISGDSLVTARGISLGSTKNEVMDKYGNRESQAYNSASDQWYQMMVSNGNGDAQTFAASASFLEYFTKPYGIRFHFDQQDQLTGILYFRDLTRNDEGITAKNILLNEGYYTYDTTDIYDNDSQTVLHSGEVHCSNSAESYSAALEKDRYPFGLMADPVVDMRIANVTDSTFTAYYEEWPGIEKESYYNEDSAWKVFYYKENDRWRPADSQAEPDFYWVVNDSDTFTLYDSYDKLDGETGAVTGHYTEVRTYKRIK